MARKRKKMKLSRRTVTTRDEFALGEVAGKRWWKAPKSRNPSGKWMEIGATVMVNRVGDTGEAKPKPYRAIACIGRQGKHNKMLRNIRKGAGMIYPRLAAHRCGEGRGKTPTRAIREAFRDLGKNFK